LPPANLSTPTLRLHGLDHLRALAIIMVFMFHYNHGEFPVWMNVFSSFGWTGVDLFFVLSGYLIASQLFKHISKGYDFSIKDFYIRRFFRIVPLYALALLIYFLVPAFSQRYGPSPLWKYLTFTQNFGLHPGLYPSFTHAWSLAVEEQFYLVFPLIVAGLFYFKIFRKGIWLIAVLFVVTFLFRYIAWTQYYWPLENANIDNDFWVTKIYYTTHTRLDGLLVGITIATLFAYRQNFIIRVNKYANLLFFIGLTALIGCYYLCLDRSGFYASVYGFSAISLAYGLIVMAAILPACFLYKIKSRITSGIAILSYTMYLIHKGTTELCHKFFDKHDWDTDSMWMLAASLGVTICCALVLRYAVEKPFLKLRDKVLATRHSTAPAK